jgi:hypothetical protein
MDLKKKSIKKKAWSRTTEGTGTPDLNIVGDIKITRLGWAGHVTRMGEKRSQNGEFHNTKSVGKPRTRWTSSTKMRYGS